MTRRSIGAVLGAAIVTVGAIAFPASPAAANGLVCTVAPGYTWDYKIHSSVCGQANWTYDQITPGEGVLACFIPAGYTGTRAYLSDDCSGVPDHMATTWTLHTS